MLRRTELENRKKILPSEFERDTRISTITLSPSVQANKILTEVAVPQVLQRVLIPRHGVEIHFDINTDSSIRNGSWEVGTRKIDIFFYHKILEEMETETREESFDVLAEKLIAIASETLWHELEHDSYFVNREQYGYTSLHYERKEIVNKMHRWITTEYKSEVLNDEHVPDAEDKTFTATWAEFQAGLMKFDSANQAIRQYHLSHFARFKYILQLKSFEDFLLHHTDMEITGTGEYSLEKCIVDYYIMSFKQGLEELLIRLKSLKRAGITDKDEIIDEVDLRCFYLKVYIHLLFPNREKLYAILQNKGVDAAIQHLHELMIYENAKRYVEEFIGIRTSW